MAGAAAEAGAAETAAEILKYLHAACAVISSRDAAAGGTHALRRLP